MGSLLLVRHATTRASQAGANLGQKTDAPLVEAGRELALRTAAAILAELEAISAGALRAVTSPALRCRQTADLILQGLGRPEVEPVVEAGLWEIDYGQWEGLTAEECRRRDPELREQWEADPHATRTPGGESGGDVATRAFAVLAPLEEWLSASPEGAALAVTHNHVVRLRIAAQLGLPLADYRRRVEAAPGAYSIITFSGGRSSVRRLNVLPLEVARAPGQGV